MAMFDGMTQGGQIDPQILAMIAALQQKQQQANNPLAHLMRPHFNAMPQPQQQAPIAPTGMQPSMQQAQPVSPQTQVLQSQVGQQRNGMSLQDMIRLIASQQGQPQQ